MSRNATNKFIKNIRFAKKHCAKNRMVLVRIDVPPSVYIMLRSTLYNLKEFTIENGLLGDLCNVPINLNTSIKKPQYIMEMTNDDFF